MSNLAEALTPALCLSAVPGISKKRVLEQVAHLLARYLPDLPAQSLFEALLAREKLGSTGLGGGIALPHCRLTGCNKPIAALLRLSQAVDFDAIDGAPVDLLFVLLVPSDAHEAHLELLQQIAEKLSQAPICQRLRAAKTGAELYSIISQAGTDACA